jgi:hypothetical protein
VLLQEVVLLANFMLLNVSTLALVFELVVLVELDIPTPPGVKWTDHSLCRGGSSTSQTISVSIAVIMTWVLWKSLETPPTVVSSSIDLNDTLQVWFEFDDYRHHSPLGQLRVVLINNCTGNFDLTSAIRDRRSKVEMQITTCIQRF